jgi:hypothetical protein
MVGESAGHGHDGESTERAHEGESAGHGHGPPTAVDGRPSLGQCTVADSPGVRRSPPVASA